MFIITRICRGWLSVSFCYTERMDIKVKLIRSIFVFLALLIFSFGHLGSVRAAYYATKIIPSSYENIGTPRDVLMLSDGSMWYADSQNYRIVKIDSNGDIVRTVGRQGSDDGEFLTTPLSITRDNDGYLYVCDLQKIYKFDQYGGFIEAWGSYGSGAGQISEPSSIHYSAHGDNLVVSNSANNRITVFSTSGVLVREFGSAGTGEGEFDSPHGLTTDSGGNIYVVDSNNHRVQIFSEVGTFIREFGSSGAGNYQLVYPKDVELLTTGEIIVTSQNAPLIKKFSATGVYIAEWGTNGTESDQFVSPEYLTRASDDSLWVTDWNQKRLQHFSSDGIYLGKIGNSGASSGVFTNPYDFDYDTSGNMYVLDRTGRVQKFDANGSYVETVIAAGNVGDGAYHIKIDPDTSYILVSSEPTVKVFQNNGTFIAAIGTQGINGAASGSGDFNQARGMVIDSNGYLYVADLFNNRIQKFDLTHLSDPDFATTYNGGYVLEWTTMSLVEYLAIDGSDHIYASAPESVEENGFALQVIKYTSSGVDQGVFLDEYGVDPGQYYKISGLSIDSNNQLYVSDNYFNHILIYDSAGVYQETIGSSGGDIDQYDEAKSAKINPLDQSLAVVDRNNHRVQILTTGVKIRNLITSADVINATNSASLVRMSVNPTIPEVSELNAEMYFGNYIVSDFIVDLTNDRDWTNVNAIMLPEESRSLIVNLNPTDAPGVSSTHSLFVVKQVGQSSVRVCSSATTIAEVTSGCSGYTLQQGDPSLSVVSVGAVEYWKVSGLTGTGAISVAEENPSPSLSSTPTPTSSNSSASGSGGGGGSSSSSCEAALIKEIPDLFQINMTDTTANLYFTPLPTTNRYYVSFSTKPSAEDYGTEIELAREGVQNYKVFLLKPKTTYYFKVRGSNGCRSGDWSGIMSVTTKPKNGMGVTIYYRYGATASRSTAAKKMVIKNVVKPTDTPNYVREMESTRAPRIEEVKAEKKCLKILWWCI